jgi:hypothetical protein
MALMHVMHTLVSYGCLIVDVWNELPTCFGLDDRHVVANHGTILPDSEDSPYAKVGDDAYDNGSMQFLETRWERKRGNLFPAEAAPILDETGTLALKATFNLVTDIGKDVFRIATVAFCFEHDVFLRAEEGPSISGISGLN